MAAVLGAAFTVGVTRGSCSRAGVAAWAGGVAVLIATAVVWPSVPRLRRRFAHPGVWLDGTVLHARIRDGLRSCDLATAHVVIDDVPPRRGRQWNPAFQRAGIVTVPGIARFRVETDTGPIDFALYDTHRRAEVPREVLKALADAILAGPDRYGQAGQDTARAGGGGAETPGAAAVASLSGSTRQRLGRCCGASPTAAPNTPPIKDSKNSAAPCSPSSRATTSRLRSAPLSCPGAWPNSRPSRRIDSEISLRASGGRVVHTFPRLPEALFGLQARNATSPNRSLTGSNLVI